jgi:transposase-like protein
MNQRDAIAAEWRRIVRDQESSGLSVTSFCHRRGVAQSTFYAWRRKLEGVASFAEVKLSPEPVPEAVGIELRLAGGACVVVRPGFDRSTLTELLRILEARAGESTIREANA